MPDSWVDVAFLPGTDDRRSGERLYVVGFPRSEDFERWLEVCGSSVTVVGDAQFVPTVVGTVHLVSLQFSPTSQANES
jgi:hypothetical protein